MCTCVIDDIFKQNILSKILTYLMGVLVSMRTSHLKVYDTIFLAES